MGLSESDFRWLVCIGHVQHAREITRLDDDGREFRPTGNLSFSKRTCFVLTEEGVLFARQLGNGQLEVEGVLTKSERAHVKAALGNNGKPANPHWDADRHELHVDGQIVKRFKWPAVNQEMILSTFEEEGWPTHIDDPLPPQPEQNSKRRLSDTIKCLNRKQKHARIHFRGDGTGEGVIWEFVEETPES